MSHLAFASEGWECERPLKISGAIRNNLEALALIRPSDGFPSPSQVPPNGTLKPRCPPSPGLLLLVKLPRILEQCQVDANSETESHYPAEFSRFVVSCDPRLRSKRVLADRRMGVITDI